MHRFIVIITLATICLTVVSCGTPGKGEERYSNAVLACKCGCGGTPRPYCAHRDCACARTGVAEEAPALAMTAGCSCACGGTTQPACAHRGCVCASLTIDGGDAAAFRDPTGQEETIAACSCGCGGTPRPYCAHKDCACSKAGVATEDGVRTIIKGCKCGCGGTPRPYCAHRDCVCASMTVKGEPTEPFEDPLIRSGR